MELMRFPSRGGFSVRSIFTFALTVIITALLWVVLTSPSTHAATTATWTGGNDTILFDGHGFTAKKDFKDPTGTIPEGATVYAAPLQTGAEAGSQKLLVLYFAPGVDPPTAKTVQYVEFDYKSGVASNPHAQQSVELAPQGTSDGTGSSCSVGGIGWIICPVSVFLAESMDNLFSLISVLIETQPLMIGSEDNPMYTAWSVSRTIANVAFVIVFLIIIFSQLTSLGVSNYGLKKLVPRLIVAAVLVNISYYVCAIAIDISNIIGYSIQDVFQAIRKDVFQLTNDNFADVNNNPWTAVTTVVLAGGGIIGGVYYIATAGPYILITLLVGLGLVALFVLLVLAARQAIIVILVIIAPLAFVANLLPNTEKWFEKWKDLFMTMLIFFPAFSLVFAGSQLAGQLIIQNAGDNMITVIFGLAVQVAPLVVTPYLLKFSGGLLGRIAQIANNPRKGVMDRTKGWQHEKNEIQRLRMMSSKNPAAKPFQILDNNRRARKSLTESYQKNADSRWEESKRYKKLSERAAAADINKERVHNEHAAHIDHLKSGHGKSLVRGVDLHASAVAAEHSKTGAESANAEFGATMSAYRAGTYDTAGNRYLSDTQDKMAKNVIQTAAWKQADTNNQYNQQKAISTAMRSDDTLLAIAEGSGSNEVRIVGRERAQANAIATLTKLNKDARDNAITLMETEAVEAGVAVKDYAIKRVFADANSTDATKRLKVSASRLEAALEIAAADGQVTVFDDARSSEFIDQTVVDAVVARHVGDMKAKGGFHTQARPDLSLQRYIQDFNEQKRDQDGNLVRPEGSIEEVRAAFKRDLNKARLETLSNTNAANLGGVKFGAFVGLADDIMGDPAKGKPSILDVIDLDANGQPKSADDRAMLRRIYESLHDGLEDPSTRATMTDRLAQAREMEEKIRRTFFANEQPQRLSESERAMPGGERLSESMADNPILPTSPVEPTDDSPSDGGQPR